MLIRYDDAERYLRSAVTVVQKLYGVDNDYYNIPDMWATLYNNLGHTLRKKGDYSNALDCHYKVRCLCYSGTIRCVAGAIVVLHGVLLVL